MSKAGSDASLNSAINVPVVVTRPSEQKTSEEKLSSPGEDPVNKVDKEGVRKIQLKCFFSGFKEL